MGVKTLSYFVGDKSDDAYSMGAFKRMYGKGAQFIDVTNLTQITKTMNQLFLQK
jgi:hypothetical protein